MNQGEVIRWPESMALRVWSFLIVAACLVVLVIFLNDRQGGGRDLKVVEDVEMVTIIRADVRHYFAASGDYKGLDEEFLKYLFARDRRPETIHFPTAWGGSREIWVNDEEPIRVHIRQSVPLADCSEHAEMLWRRKFDVVVNGHELTALRDAGLYCQDGSNEVVSSFQ